MSESKLSEVIRTSLANIKDLVDVNTVIGDPIRTDNGTTIIPVSKISMGFASGGIDYFGKNAAPDPKNQNFGAGGGTGVTVSPLGFLIIKPDGDVELLNVAYPTGPAAAPDMIESVSQLIERSPEILHRLKSVFSKEKKGETDDFTRDDTPQDGAPQGGAPQSGAPQSGGEKE